MLISSICMWKRNEDIVYHFFLKHLYSKEFAVRSQEHPCDCSKRITVEPVPPRTGGNIRFCTYLHDATKHPKKARIYLHGSKSKNKTAMAKWEMFI